jgi:hypothetical protein
MTIISHRSFLFLAFCSSFMMILFYLGGIMIGATNYLQIPLNIVNPTFAVLFLFYIGITVILLMKEMSREDLPVTTQ